MNYELIDKSIPQSSGVRFYTISDLMDMLGWSKTTVQKLFNDPNFPSADYGRNKVIEEHALRAYFARKHTREKEAYWR